MVDGANAPRELAAVAGVVGNEHAMLDDARRRAARIPHHRVPRRHVNDHDLRIVDDVSLRERMLERRIVLEVDLGQATLRRGKELVLIDEVALRRLEQDDVERLIADELGRYLLQIVRPRKRPNAPTIWMPPLRRERDDEVVRRLREVPEIV